MGVFFETLYPALVAPNKINYCKFCLAVDILTELELVRVDRRTGQMYVQTTDGKVNLGDSRLYAYLIRIRQTAAAQQQRGE